MASASRTHNDAELSSFVQDGRFSRSFQMPNGTGQVEPFNITYSDFGYRNEEDPTKERVLLFCSPLLGR